MASAIRDRRHPSYIDHSLTDLLRQRILQTACGYADGNDANSLRHDPVFKLATERAPLDADNALASGPTFSRLENGIYRKDIYCLAQAFVDAFIASYAAASAIIGRVVRRLRQAWPDTHIVLRGDGHFANPELMALCRDDDQLDFIFGLAGNKVLTPKAEPLLEKARALHAERGERARQQNQAAPTATRLYDEVTYQAGSWPQAYRVVVKAEVMALGTPEKAKTPPSNDLSLAELANGFSGSWQALAAHLGLSERTLYRRLKALEKSGES